MLTLDFSSSLVASTADFNHGFHDLLVLFHDSLVGLLRGPEDLSHLRHHCFWRRHGYQLREDTPGKLELCSATI